MNDDGSDGGTRWLPEPGDDPDWPVRQELELKRTELSGLQEEGIQREMKCETLRAQVEGFAFTQLFRLGRLYARIDELQQLIAEALLAQAPDDPVLQRRAQEAQASAERSREAAADAEESGPPRPVRLTPELKELYRQAARRVHPDLGRASEDREFRHEFMVRLNDAYTSGDVEGVRDVLASWDAQVQPEGDVGVAEELVRVIRAIARLRRTLERLDREIEAIRARPEHTLMIRAHRAEAEGVDLLAEMERKHEARIEELEARLRELGEEADA